MLKDTENSINDLNLARRIVDALTIELNELHQTNKPALYWETLLLPNIQLIVEQVADLIKYDANDLGIDLSSMFVRRFKFTGDLDFLERKKLKRKSLF